MSFIVSEFLPFLEKQPHVVLGLHEQDGEKKLVRLYRPGEEKAYIELKGQTLEAFGIGEGFFEVEVPFDTSFDDYRVFHVNGLLGRDPYAFDVSLGEQDLYYFTQGLHYELYKVLGGRVDTNQGVKGVRFTLWAPSAQAVHLVADFNHWDDRVTPMRQLGESGVWEIFIPDIGEGEKYKFSLLSQEGQKKVKSDPMAYHSELRPSTASIIYDVSRYKWNDELWMQKRLLEDMNRPILTYELHLGSWKKGEEEFPNFRDIASELASYCKEMGFTHIELLPIAEHPLDESWGYQVSGFYAVTSRYGTPEDFQYFVDYMHQEGLGVILDWVPAHFPSDAFSLAEFDGTHLYEHRDPRQGFHPHWNTCIFNYGRNEVSNFLIANALFWMDLMHIDGLRVDAVASMLYLDYGREEGGWIPNRYGGKENLEAIEFIKHLNSAVHERFPKVLMIAEESTTFSGVTRPLEWNGLGFDLKWNMGWMNDTLSYFQVDPLFRSHHRNELTFGLLYAFSERFSLALSHDEVVHGKKSLLSKMPGDLWQKFANLRALYSYMICQPGKKLIFMGAELGQVDEWACKSSLPWSLLEDPKHKALHTCVRDINHLYLQSPAFWERDFDAEGFEWVDFSDQKNSIISYLRKSQSSTYLCVHNFTPAYFPEYHLSLSQVSCRDFVSLREVFCSDREEYGGSGKVNADTISPKEQGATLQLAPLATMIFEVHFDTKA